VGLQVVFRARGIGYLSDAPAQDRDLVSAGLAKADPLVQKPFEREGLSGKQDGATGKPAHTHVFTGKTAPRVFGERSRIDEEFFHAVQTSDTVLQSCIGEKTFGLIGGE
jgi:hypothetical protein